MTQSFSGGMDLSGIAEAQKQENEPAQAADYVVRLTGATIQATMQQSLTVPVIVLFTMDGLPGEVGDRLEAATKKSGGRFQLAVANAQTEPELMAAFQCQGAPAGYALVGGRSIIPLFQGNPTTEQIDAVVGQVLELAKQAGIGGRISGNSQEEGASAAEREEHYVAGAQALARGDFDAAAREFQQSLDKMPENEAARVGLAQVKLLERTAGLDPTKTLAAADAAGPSDVEAQMAAADVEVAHGRPDLGFTRLIDAIAPNGGDAKEELRQHLLELFDVVGADQPLVADARKRLASALF
ncbi:tetratricopeptide repeat protein [Actinobaculum massiliense]|uniref:Thioredoxin domain-containing protein n=1 Tax=Actinobaculum massiliense ACS-171-V-Col2 TaxID=883066 RepID=K9EFZ9_9ACTO|nr:tetratricopeptide repeat protein [Actinobaculum massiliense]EKU95583.1 hypothetical protein HMPREF9233_00370 [Actinobaculum massiliense ACS-171-V-Col2]MDK8319039.1 tetratricopeptide repeat protein [Actinobaculum massiliense]MDK8567674.1 tetratricopeptide repeat protein [Actinobaculum massiliense]